jgi:hypothetical protein
MRMRPRARLRLTLSGALGIGVAGLASSASVACGSSDQEQLSLGSDEGGPSFMSGSGDDGGAQSLRVSTSPAAPAVCAGECVTLSAQASGGKAPYSYQWSDGVASDGGSATVCPTATTTYSVTATDSSGHVGELGSPSAKATASATVPVAPACDAGPSSSDGGTGTAQTICTAQWTAVEGVSYVDQNMTYVQDLGPPLVAVDAMGDIVVAETETFGGDASDSSFAHVMKFDAQCRMLWSKTYASTHAGGATGTVTVGNLATDASENIAFSGSLLGTLDFGAGSVGSDPGATTFITKLDPDGNAVWSRDYSNYAAGQVSGSLAFDPAGNLLASFFGVADVTLGGGPLGGVPLSESDTYSLELGPDGTYVNSAFVARDESFGLAATGTSAFVVGGEAGGPVDWAGGTTTSTAAFVGIVGAFGPGTTYQWATVVPTSIFSSRASSGFSPNSQVLVGARGSVFMMYGAYGALDGPDGGEADPSAPQILSEGLVKLSPAGAVEWTDESDFGGASVTPYNQSGFVSFVASDVSGSGADSEILVRRIASAGHVDSSATWGGPGPNHVRALATNAPAGPVIVSSPVAGPTASPVTMTVAKLAW